MAVPALLVVKRHFPEKTPPAEKTLGSFRKTLGCLGETFGCLGKTFGCLGKTSGWWSPKHLR